MTERSLGQMKGGTISEFSGGVQVVKDLENIHGNYSKFNDTIALTTRFCSRQLLLLANSTMKIIDM